MIGEEGRSYEERSKGHENRQISAWESCMKGSTCHGQDQIRALTTPFNDPCLPLVNVFVTVKGPAALAKMIVQEWYARRSHYSEEAPLVAELMPQTL